MKNYLLILVVVLSMTATIMTCPVSAQTFDTEMLSMDLSGYHPGDAIDLDDGAYRNRKGQYVVVRNKRVIEMGNDFRMMKSRSGHRAAANAPGNVKSSDKPQEAALLLPAVQSAREPANRSDKGDCDVAWMKIELENVMITSYQTNASGNDEVPADGAYKVKGGGYAIVKNGRVIEKGANWRSYRPKGESCGSPVRVRSNRTRQ